MLGQSTLEELDLVDDELSVPWFTGVSVPRDNQLEVAVASALDVVLLNGMPVSRSWTTVCSAPRKHCHRRSWDRTGSVCKIRPALAALERRLGLYAMGQARLGHVADGGRS